MEKTRPRIAFIGTGVMGEAMASRLSHAGFPVILFNRTREKADRIAEETGTVSAASAADAVRDADVVITMVGYPADVEDVLLGTGRVFDTARKGTLIIDMTTSQPSFAMKLYRVGKDKGFRVLDAPVSGGDEGAKKGTLSVMVGGDEEDFRAAEPIFTVLGKNIVYMGAAGNGQHTKAANQIAVAGATAAMTEALMYAERTGLDPEKMFAAIGGGAAGSWQIAHMAPRVLAGDKAPGFYVRHFVKDMNIIHKETAVRGVYLPILESVRKLYKKMVETGYENLGTQALILLYREGRAGEAKNFD